MSNYTIGVDAGGTKVAYGLFDENGKRIDRMQHPTDAQADGAAFSDEVLRNLDRLIEQNGLQYKDVRGVGICMPSFILFDEGYVCMTSAMPGIKDFSMKKYLSERMPLHFVLDNDSNAAALAEYTHGAGRGCRHMVYIAAGTGIGSGIIIDGKLFRGSYGWAGECGHMLATPDEGVMCGCENQGCFMSYASGRYVPAQVRLSLDAGQSSIMQNDDSLSCIDIFKAYEAGDALAVETIASMAHWIAVCVFNVYQMLNINTFVFGGGLLHFGDALFSRVRSEFDRYNHIPKPVYFRFAELGDDFGIIGASEFAKE